MKIEYSQFKTLPEMLDSRCPTMVIVLVDDCGCVEAQTFSKKEFCPIATALATAAGFAVRRVIQEQN